LHIAGTRLLKYTEEDGITEVVIPDSITEISRDCFNNCRRLKSIIIPDSVTLICAGAFADCFSLETINIPARVLYIGSKAFLNCRSLKNISFPDGLEFIDQYAFEAGFCWISGVCRNKMSGKHQKRIQKTENHILLMIPLIVQIYIYSRMSEAEQYISDNLITVLRNLSYNGEYTLVQSLLEFSYLVNLDTLGEINNYFHECHDEKMIEIIQNKLEHIHLMMNWESLFYSQEHIEDY